MRGASCTVVESGARYEGKQGLEYFEGVSAETTGAAGICMHRLVIPPGAVAQAHLHEGHETAIFVLSGRAKMRHGEGLAEELEAGPGDYVFIPAGTPHQPYNPFDEPLVGVLARTDPNEQESVVLLDEAG